MRARVAALAILLAVPFADLLAQRGGRGGNDMGGPRSIGRDNDAMQFPKASDLAKYNPAALLAESRKPLALSDAQVTMLTTLRQTIITRNADVMARYDSVQRVYRPDPIPSPYGRDKEELEQAKRLQSLLDSLHMRRILDVADAVALVTEDNARLQAAALLVRQEAEYRSRMPRQNSSGPRDYLAPRGGQ